MDVRTEADCHELASEVEFTEIVTCVALVLVAVSQGALPDVTTPHVS